MSTPTPVSRMPDVCCLHFKNYEIKEASESEDSFVRSQIKIAGSWLVVNMGST